MHLARYCAVALTVHPLGERSSGYLSVDSLTSDQRRLFDRMRGALTGTEAAHFSDSRHLVMFLKYFGRVYGTSDEVLKKWESSDWETCREMPPRKMVIRMSHLKFS